jgi:hypothetical protein
MMVKQQASAESYYICCLVVCFTFTLYSSVLIDKDKAEACRLCRKFKKAKVEEAYYKVDAKKLYSVLYCSGCKRVKEDKDLSYYFELIISQCLTDLRYCRVIMKYLSRYEVDEESEDTICFYVVKQNKKTYFISFKEDSINE